MADKKYNLKMTLTDGTELSAGVITAPQGPAGPTGPTGPQGIQGPKGNKGDTGLCNVKAVNITGTVTSLPEDYTPTKYVIVGQIIVSDVDNKNYVFNSVITGDSDMFWLFGATTRAANSLSRLTCQFVNHYTGLAISQLRDYATNSSIDISSITGKLVFIEIIE